MRDCGISPVYIRIGENDNVQRAEVPFNYIFNTELPNNDLYLDFESRFEPYEEFVYDSLERVDLVVREARAGGAPGRALRALEVKLTVVPDSSTFQSEPEYWGPEIVVRPPTIMYCGLGMVASPDVSQEAVREIFLPMGRNVVDWGNEAEALRNLGPAIAALDQFQSRFKAYQRPLVLQPIWKTNGKTPMLDEHAFDIFVWSDFALARVFIDLARRNTGSITRHARSTLRLARFLFEYGRAAAANLHTIYSGMTYSHQSDKEFSLNGCITSKYMQHPRLTTPILQRDIVKDIILEGGEANLSPERRFDQTIYFTYEFEKND